MAQCHNSRSYTNINGPAPPVIRVGIRTSYRWRAAHVILGGAEVHVVGPATSRLRDGCFQQGPPRPCPRCPGRTYNSAR